MLLQLLSALLVILSTEADLNCPQDFQYDPTYGCIALPFPNTRSGIYNYCAQYSASIFKVRNSFDNTAYLQMCPQAYPGQCWLGITCTTTNVTSCQYDNGDPLTYNNFGLGQPSTDGPCVCISKYSGLWHSCRCYQSAFAYCQIDQSSPPQSCIDYQNDTAYYDFYRGGCYFNNQTQSATSAESFCESRCGRMVSIHSKEENNYYTQYLAEPPYDHSLYTYAYLGLQHSKQGFSWNDNSAFDYSNFDMTNSTDGPCVQMSLQGSSAGKWFSAPCSTSSHAMVSLCVRDPVNSCASAVPDPMTPILCHAEPKMFTTDDGTIYSPGYPRGALKGLHCQYNIVLQPGKNVTATLDYDLPNDFQMLGQLNFYDSLAPDASPFLTLRGGNGTRTISRMSNTMQIAFTAGSSFNSKFAVKYWNQ